MKQTCATISLAAILMLSLVTSCSVTTAPTEESTASFGKTSDASTDMTSSTSPGSSGDSLAGVEEFTRVNYASIKREMAAGDGEHLAALGALLQIPEHNIPRFCAFTQQQYPQLYASAETSPQQMLSALQLAFAANPTMVQ